MSAAISAGFCVCFVQALPEDDRKQALDGMVKSMSIVTKERECSSFVRWVQGHSPKEHKEMVDAEKLREWQESRRKEDMDRQDARDNILRQWQEQQQWKNRIWGIVQTVIGLIIGAVITYFLKK